MMFFPAIRKAPLFAVIARFYNPGKICRLLQEADSAYKQ
jgi:hypothetical protein